jgi:thiol:disulfide interchange protein DsbC
MVLLAGAVATHVALAADSFAELRKVIQARYPEVKVVDIKPTPITGLYEIYTGDAIVYSNDSGGYLVAGPLVDTRTRENLTAASLDTRNAVDFSTLPLDKAIKTVKGNGARKMAVFADPDCPYCKKLEHELVSVDNITVYTFLYPLEELHPDAKARARAIWCSSDRSQAWTKWIVDGKEPAAAPATCKQDPLSEMRALGVKLRVNSTPTLIFADGRRTSGALEAAQLEKRLDAKKPDASSPGS